MKFFPHPDSTLSEPNTGEDIIAASDEKQIAAGTRKVQRTMWEYLRNPRRRNSVV
jgi:NCS1 family nucleobase:cation symporter-1